MLRRYMLWVLLGLVLSGCGAADDIPGPPQPAAETCPTLRALAPLTFQTLESNDVPTLKRVLSEEISDAHLTALVNATIALVRSLQQVDFESLSALQSSPELPQLDEGLSRLLRFLSGTPEEPFREEVFTDLRRIVTHCRATPLVAAIKEAVYSPELPELLLQLDEVLSLEPVQRALAADQYLGRDGFTVFICNTVANLIQADFSVANDVVQPLARLNILPLDMPPFSSFLRSLDTVLSADRPLKPALANLVCCDLYNVAECNQVTPATVPVERDPVFSWLIYDLFVDQQEAFGRFLSALGGLARSPEVGEAAKPIWSALVDVTNDDEIKDAANSLLRIVLTPGITQPLLRELALLIERGIIGELAAMGKAIQRGCNPEDMTR